MFRADYRRFADEVKWLWPQPDQPKAIFFIEGWLDVNPHTGAVQRHYRNDWLLNSEIDTWLHREVSRLMVFNTIIKPYLSI